VRDLEREWGSYSAGRRGQSSEPRSLWEELADVGEELVEFLEKVGVVCCMPAECDLCTLS
jgi:sugar phosphate isomerase/epimerase